MPATASAIRSAVKVLPVPQAHDQLASIVICETSANTIESGLLMRAQPEQLMLEGKLFRLGAAQIGPVEWPTLEIAEAKHTA